MNIICKSKSWSTLHNPPKNNLIQTKYCVPYFYITHIPISDLLLLCVLMWKRSKLKLLWNHYSYASLCDYYVTYGNSDGGRHPPPSKLLLRKPNGNPLETQFASTCSFFVLFLQRIKKSMKRHVELHLNFLPHI